MTVHIDAQIIVICSFFETGSGSLLNRNILVNVTLLCADRVLCLVRVKSQSLSEVFIVYHLSSYAIGPILRVAFLNLCLKAKRSLYLVTVSKPRPLFFIYFGQPVTGTRL